MINAGTVQLECPDCGERVDIPVTVVITKKRDGIAYLSAIPDVTPFREHYETGHVPDEASHG